ncbi:hypothetical protein A0U92_00025 [Acetobacter aceti]|uniref:Uncharacterized protein n=1 Tax=Acetobacter aceti TaxID=435 RepID=A0A1U9KC48_ACEAC|nr:hypothetical protein A0U92_00025 [Acetobacter aceti]
MRPSDQPVRPARQSFFAPAWHEAAGCKFTHHGQASGAMSREAVTSFPVASDKQPDICFYSVSVFANRTISGNFREEWPHDRQEYEDFEASFGMRGRKRHSSAFAKYTRTGLFCMVPSACPIRQSGRIENYGSYRRE